MCLFCRVRGNNDESINNYRNGDSEGYQNLDMESRIGLDYIVENPEYTVKLATGNYLTVLSNLYSF